MSIDSLIAHWISEGRLHDLKPDPELGDPVERHMIVSEEIRRLIDGPWESEAWERRCGKLEEDLHSFVRGDRIPVSFTPHKHKTAFMGRLSSPDDAVWDIRSRDPKPGLRVFGRFAKVNTFVAFFWSPRSVEIPWSNRPPLRDDDREWRDACNECKAEWRKLFHPYDPVRGDEVHEYISEKAVVVRDKKR